MVAKQSTILHCFFYVCQQEFDKKKKAQETKNSAAWRRLIEKQKQKREELFPEGMFTTITRYADKKITGHIPASKEALTEKEDHEKAELRKQSTAKINLIRSEKEKHLQKLSQQYQTELDGLTQKYETARDELIKLQQQLQHNELSAKPGVVTTTVITGNNRTKQSEQEEATKRLQQQQQEKFEKQRAEVEASTNRILSELEEEQKAPQDKVYEEIDTENLRPFEETVPQNAILSLNGQSPTPHHYADINKIKKLFPSAKGKYSAADYYNLMKYLKTTDLEKLRSLFAKTPTSDNQQIRLLPAPPVRRKNLPAENKQQVSNPASKNPKQITNSKKLITSNNKFQKPLGLALFAALLGYLYQSGHLNRALRTTTSIAQAVKTKGNQLCKRFFSRNKKSA